MAGPRRSANLPTAERWPKRSSLPHGSVVIIDRGIPTLVVEADDKTPTSITQLVLDWPDPWP